jgi:hypothetical protein
MKLRKLAIWMIALAPVTALAEAVTPSAPGPTTGPNGPREGRGQRPPFGGGPGMREYREQEWKDALAFFNDNSPKRAKQFALLTPAEQEKLKPYIIGKYNAYQWMTRDNAKLKDVKIQQLKLEDDIYQLNKDRKDPKLTSEQVQKIETELKKTVGDLVAARLSERRLRIDRLEEIVAKEEAELEKDKARQDDLVTKEFRKVLASDEDKLPDGPRRPRPGPNGGGEPNPRKDRP